MKNTRLSVAVMESLLLQTSLDIGLEAEYIPDEQILQNREGIDFSPEDFGSDKKTKRKVKRFMRG